jgi:mannose-6-phosphate isomerase-like protein (cupin superfamily)
MTRVLWFAALLTGAVMFQVAGEAAQSAPPTAPAAQPPAAQQGGPQPAGRGGGGGNAERPTNERSNVDIDQFIGTPINSTGHLSHGGLFTRSILRQGNPNLPGPQGAVLEYRTQLAAAVLPPKSGTPLMRLNSQFLFYVVGGHARLDDGKNFWELREGITMLIPPEVERRFVNTADEPLEMLMLEWPANERARKDILVRDTNLMPYCEENVHWNNMSKCVFSADDGMTGRMLIVMLMPFTMASPHHHTPGTEEFWTKITPGNAILLLGSELRDMPQYTAFLAPPNGITWHAQLNTSKTQIEKWLYISGGAPPVAGQGGGAPAAAAAPPANIGAAPTAQVQGGGRGGRGGGNPNLLNRDPAAIEQATVKGTPLK